MAAFTVKLIGRKEVARGTTAFYFEKPKDFQFRAGQFVLVNLIDPPETDAEGDSRTFSLASAPYEAVLMVATRMRDTAFKRVLGALALGDEVAIRGPYGRLGLHEDAARPAVLLTGGIGITPFRSILLQAQRDGLPHRVFLFYANRTPQDAAFLPELRGVETGEAGFGFIPTVTAAGAAAGSWRGETGHISIEMLSRYVADLLLPVYYIAGPHGMVAAMQRMLVDAGVGGDSIRAEEFSGY